MKISFHKNRNRIMKFSSLIPCDKIRAYYITLVVITSHFKMNINDCLSFAFKTRKGKEQILFFFRYYNLLIKTHQWTKLSKNMQLT